jgi:hypothetical protein
MLIYTMNMMIYIQLNNYKLNELPYVYFESNLNKRVDSVEMCLRYNKKRNNYLIYNL